MKKKVNLSSAEKSEDKNVLSSSHRGCADIHTPHFGVTHSAPPEVFNEGDEGKDKKEEE